MRILLWHGWLLAGSGSNVAAARVAEVYRHQGHDVLLLCQEAHHERYPFVDAWGTAGPEGVRIDGGEPDRAAGLVVLLRPEIGTLLPVFVYDEYEGFDVKRFVDLTDDELAGYVDANVAALRSVAAWRTPDAAIVGHAVAGPLVARHALGPGAYVAKLHGSDLEYAVRAQPRYRAMAAEGLSAARAVVGGSEDVLVRAESLVPTLPARRLAIAPGVDVEAFAPVARSHALSRAADLLERDAALSSGRPAVLDGTLRWALRRPDGADLDDMAATYDQDAPDQDAPTRLRALVAHDGPIVGYLGKLIPQKGVDLLLQALALLPDRVRGLIVGFGAYRERLEALVTALDRSDDALTRTWNEQLRAHASMPIELTTDELVAARGLRRRVTFTGRLDHRYAPLALSAMDVLVVPSTLDEAFGMVAAEGAAAGALPLVARHSGLAEVAAALESAVNRPGLFSFESGPGAVHRIAEGIERLLRLPHPERAKLRLSVSAFAHAEWTWDRTAGRLLEAATR